jgi:hypothetical protein
VIGLKCETANAMPGGRRVSTAVSARSGGTLPGEGRKLAAENNYFLRSLDGDPHAIALDGSHGDPDVNADVNGLSCFPAQYKHWISSLKQTAVLPQAQRTL